LIGWRAAEQHFLRLMRENLPGKIPVQAVAANKEQAELTLSELAKAGIQYEPQAMDGGFTEYVLNRGAERFFA